MFWRVDCLWFLFVCLFVFLTRRFDSSTGAEQRNGQSEHKGKEQEDRGKKNILILAKGRMCRSQAVSGKEVLGRCT